MGPSGYTALVFMSAQAGSPGTVWDTGKQEMGELAALRDPLRTQAVW